MSEYLSEFKEYIKKYLNRNYEDLREASLQFRPRKGWGNFYRSDEVYKFFFNMHANVQDNLLNLDIPESHPSPKALINFVKNFLRFLESKDELFDDIIAHYDDPSKISLVVVEANSFRTDLIEVFRHALKLPEVHEILEDSEKEKVVPETVDKENKEDDEPDIETKDPSNLRAVLEAYDLEKVPIFQWITILSTGQMVGIATFIVGVIIGGYKVGQTFQKNNAVLNSIEDKRQIYLLQDSLETLKNNYQDLENLQNSEGDSIQEN